MLRTCATGASAPRLKATGSALVLLVKSNINYLQTTALPGFLPLQEPPFREPKLLPLSPPRGGRSWLLSPPVSPTMRSQTDMATARRVTDAACSADYCLANMQSAGRAELGPSNDFTTPARYRSVDLPQRPMSPDGLGGGIYSSHTMGQGLEGLICASPAAAQDARFVGYFISSGSLDEPITKKPYRRRSSEGSKRRADERFS